MASLAVVAIHDDSEPREGFFLYGNGIHPAFMLKL